MKKALIIITILVVLAGSIFAYNRYKADQSSAASLESMQTVKAEKGSLTSIVGATGTVRSNQSAVLAWQTSGKIEGVSVTLGEQVTVNDVLANLSKTSLSQNIILAQSDLVNAEKDMENLLESSLQAAQALQAVEDAEQALEDAQNPELAQAQAAQAIVDAENLVDTYERKLWNLKTAASQSYIDSAEAQVVLARDALDRAEKNYEPYADKPDTNLIKANLKSQLATAQQNYDRAVRNLNSLMSTGSELDIKTAEANLQAAQAQLTTANREWERIKDGVSPATLALYASQLEDTQREYDRLKDGPDPADLLALQARVDSAQASIDMISLSAPFEGTVTQVFAKPGDIVSPGTSGFRIDDLSRLLVDVDISEVDINQIATGQEVVLTFDAILAKEYHGVVIEVSPVAAEMQGVVTFMVTVELTDKDEQVKPGMTSGVNIVVSELEDVLLVLSRAIRVEDGQRVVYIYKNNKMEMVQVTLGASSDTQSQIIDGDLKEGDVIILNPTTLLEFGQDHPAFMGPQGR